MDSPLETQALLRTVAQISALNSHPIIDGEPVEGEAQETYNPTDQQQLIGHYSKANEADILRALESAHAAQPDWDSLGHSARADLLDKVADLMERDSAELIGVIAAEGGRTLGDGVSEVREAIDFCRYYSLQARSLQVSSLQASLLQGMGVFLCISPWNFPLAIFVGQIAAALATGNTVIAKPAAQTPAIAACAIRLFHEAGIPGAALQLLLGSGSQIGKLLVGDSRIAGIAFTGSTDTAQTHQPTTCCTPRRPDTLCRRNRRPKLYGSGLHRPARAGGR